MTDQDRSLANLTLTELTAALASSTPTPGGGSASALAAALGASLIAMVARLSQDRPRYEAHAGLHAEAVSRADAARMRFLELADADAAAYAAYARARRLPHASQAETDSRDAASRAAARGAADVPLAVVQECHHLIELLERLAGRSNASASSDLDVAALLLHCAARGAGANALVNLPAVGDEAYAAAVSSEIDERLRQIEAIAARTHEWVGSLRSEPAST